MHRAALEAPNRSFGGRIESHKRTLRSFSTGSGLLGGSFSEPLLRAAVLPILPVAYSLELQLFILLAVGHAGAVEGLGLVELFLGNQCVGKIGPAQVGAT